MALAQLVCLLPWPWRQPSSAVSPGLSLPMQSPAAAAEGLGGPLLGPFAPPAFKFQPRRESVDWRRIGALDVERVARELDVGTLQENIAGVTFCDLGREACGRCGQPVDPALLKVLRLAQLTIEYLLHCQDCLSAGVAQLEARLQASLGQQERGRQELGRRADELKGVREESRRRRRMIGTLQQLLLQTGAHAYHTCHLCDKTFMNAAFLRGHIQRRHAGVAEGGKQKQQEQLVEEALEELRAKLKWTQEELDAQREAERRRQLQEAELTRQREIEAKKEFEEWKEKEQAKLYGEIDKLRKLFWDEFKSVANQNSTLEEKLQALQSHSVTESHLGSLRDEEREERLGQAQELRALKEKMDMQKKEWKRKMKELQEEHVAQKKELQEENARLRASLSREQRAAAADGQRQLRALRARLEEQARLLAAQEQQIQTLSLRKAEGTPREPTTEDMEGDSPEEELEDSGSGRQEVLAALRRNPALLKQFRPILEDTLEEKLESMGIKRGAKGISVPTLRRLETLLGAQREQKAGRFSEFLSLREKLIKDATRKVKERRKSCAAASPPDGDPPVGSQRSAPVTHDARPEPRTLQVASPSGPAPTLQSREGPGPKRAPTPAPRPGVLGRPASPGPGLSTPPFSSEEDSEGSPARRPSVQPPPARSGVDAPAEEDWDWSDSDTSQGSPPPPGRGSGTLVQSMVRNLEKQLEAPVKKPAGGVSLFLMPNSGPQRPATPGRKPQISEDDSDLEISSLEDLPQDLHQGEKPTPLTRSRLLEKPGTSPWSSGQPRVPGW
ncbi:cilium assembly protein DZIP1L isoform X2 [Dasypus novemcinctus]|uniref:cilium assembly protein DZIP1L isoform X2 n=2 Tax=Dasypus novemcinctus TaxID=9361 RepID=UPI00265E87A1|nr:cilium assembly protein DZIP1L isoform X2 [Dasypus novemcinctus]